MRTVTCVKIETGKSGDVHVHYTDTAGQPLGLSFKDSAALIAWLEAAENNAPLEYLLALAIMQQYRAGVALGSLYDGAQTITTLDTSAPKVEAAPAAGKI